MQFFFIFDVFTTTLRTEIQLMKRINRIKRLKNRKRKIYVTLLVLSTIIFAQALIIAKFYTEKQEKKYTVNLVEINTEKDSIDYPRLKNDLENIDDFVKNMQSFLKNKNISDTRLDQLKRDSLSNDIYLAKTSNRYSQYLVDLQNKLMGVPLGIPTEGYISSQFGKRKNPIPVKTTQKAAVSSSADPLPSAPTPVATTEKTVDGPPQILKIKDKEGNVVDEITIIPKIKVSVSDAVKTPQKSNAAKTTVREENNAASEPDQIQFHKGLDVAVAYGTDVKAAASGTVIFSGVKGGYGNCVIISHGNGLATLYGHLSELLVKANDKVLSNQVIAKSGNSGRSTGPHLHYEVHKNNVPVNPKLFLNL